MTKHWLDGIDIHELLKDVIDCEYCGDGIPKDGMKEHLSWCKPMFEKPMTRYCSHTSPYIFYDGSIGKYKIRNFLISIGDEIDYCPYCGTKLEPRKPNEWAKPVDLS